MSAMHLLVGMAAMALPALSQSPVAQKLLHTSTSFDLTVHASYAKTAPLFGPEGERAWAGKHWNPVFMHPQPAADVEGAVFTIQHGNLKAVWVTSAFDADARHFQYVYFLPDLMVTVIDVRFKPEGASSTAVHVVYTRTALCASNFALNVVLADAASYAAIPQMERMIEAYATPRANFVGTGYVVNQVDQSRQLTKDVLKVLRNLLGNKLFPGVIHLDEGVSESLACDTTLIHYDPLSQAAADLRTCGEWLTNAVDSKQLSPRSVA